MSLQLLHELDGWSVHDDMQAFRQGFRLDLEVVSYTDQGVMAKPCNEKISTTLFECVIPKWCLQYIDVGRTFTVLNFRMIANSRILVGKDAMLFPILHPMVSADGVAEAFGGLGGWTLGARLTGTHVSLIVEEDAGVVQAASRSLGVPYFTIDAMMEMAQSMSLPDEAIVIADVLDPRVWVLAGFMNIACWLASPPCPPWSGASRVRGLFADAGQTLVKFIYLLGISRSRCANLENVPGLPKHVHFTLVKQALCEAGMELTVSSVDRLTPLLPATRPRWLATCVRKGFVIADHVLSRVKNLGIPSRLSDTLGESIQNSDVVQWTLQDWEMDQCLPTHEAVELMSGFDLLPLNLRKDGMHKMSPGDIFKLRVKSTKQILPNVMALQGAQHELPKDLLQEKGLYSFLAQVADTERFSTPFEILGALGFPPQMCLPDVFRQAWHLTGNTLSVAHSALQCLRARWLLGDASGIGTKLNGAFDVCNAVRGQMIRFTNLKVVREDGWMTLVPLNPAGAEVTDMLSDAESVVSVLTTVPDRPEPFSATLPFPICEPSHGKRVGEEFDEGQDAKRQCLPNQEMSGCQDPVLIPQVLNEEFPHLEGLRESGVAWLS
eukprot:Skav215108  [mRNA]  locus=scaffold1567:117820:119640:- [translate_table: standard]